MFVLQLFDLSFSESNASCVVTALNCVILLALSPKVELLEERGRIYRLLWNLLQHLTKSSANKDLMRE